MAASEKSKTENPMSVVKQHITDRSFSRIYLFCGSEQYLARQCMNNLVEAIVPDKANSMSYTRFVSEKCDLNAICSDMVTLPFFDEYRLTLVEDSGYFSSSNDKLKDAFETVGEQNIVIFYETNIDKRTSTYKAISKIGTVLEFETPDEETLTRWIIGRFAEDNLQIQRGVPEELLQIAGENMLNLSIADEESIAAAGEAVTAFCQRKNAGEEQSVLMGQFVDELCRHINGTDGSFAFLYHQHGFEVIFNRFFGSMDIFHNKYCLLSGLLIPLYQKSPQTVKKQFIIHNS